MDTTGYSLIAAAALACGSAGTMLWRRLQLSRAKHPSLAGHSRLAKRLARWMPALAYDAERFFAVDGAPPQVVSRRRHGLDRLARVLGTVNARGLTLTDQIAAAVPDVEFTTRYRVPAPFSAYVRRHLRLPAFIDSTHANRIYDLDGKELIDLGGSYGVNVFGLDFYRTCIEEAVRRAARTGPILGPYHPALADVVERLRHISGHAAVSFHMSGTEAVMQAVRLARYHTRRRYIVRFCGAYHGWWEDVQPGIGNPLPPRETYTLRDMDRRSLNVLAQRHDIACVLVNPLQAMHPNRAAPGDSTLMGSRKVPSVDRALYANWLAELREVCTRAGILLIFDEVFLGFRLAKGGAQAYYDVRADLVTYGKTLGGGLPIGAVCGPTPLMRRYRESAPADICFARGTFNSHPYVICAAQVFLERLDSGDYDALYASAESVWRDRLLRFNQALAEAGYPLQASGLQSVWALEFTQPGRYHWMLQFYLRAAGLALSWVGSGRLIFPLNLGDDDFAEVVARVLRAARQMAEDGWWWALSPKQWRATRQRFALDLLRARLARA